MSRETQRREQLHFTAYAGELREKFNTGLLKELTPYRQFIVWKYKETGDKQQKPPYNPRTHSAASPTDPDTWGTHTDALKALTTGQYNGIGFVFTATDPFMGLDLDHCVHTNRRIDYQANEITRQFQSYTEYSARDGLHVLIKAKAPFTTRKLNGIELFASGHTLGLTLRHVAGSPATIEARQEELDLLLADYDTGMNRIGDKHPATSVVWRGEPRPITEVEGRLIEHWKTEPGNFTRYFEGDRTLWTGRGKLVNSKSEADFILCLMLLTKTHDDVEQVKRLFHESELYDPQKTDRVSGHDPRTGKPVTYLEMTIFNALKKRPKH